MKKKICKECGELFEPVRKIQPTCSLKCAIALAKKKVKDKQVKEFKKWSKETKENLRTHSELLNLLQVVINKIVRTIDFGQPCISCGKNGKRQAGHYHSIGANSALRFHLDNIHIQDYRCNVELSGNIIGYNRGLINTYGEDYKVYVERDLLNIQELKLQKHEIVDLIKKAKEILKELPEFEVYTASERILERKRINNLLGIYSNANIA